MFYSTVLFPLYSRLLSYGRNTPPDPAIR